MSTVAEKVPFSSLCKLCEKICKKKGKDKQNPLEQFIRKWREFHAQLHPDDQQTTDSFFPVLRLLLPQCERERSAYGIKETTLANLYIKIFCLNKNSADAQKLLNYRSPQAAKDEAGDFANVAYFILKKHCSEKSNLTIHEINHHLDNVAMNKATKNKTEILNSMQFLLRNTTALEQKWLIRMILKDMKMGVSENTVLKAFHVDAKDLYNVTSSLEKVCARLKDPSVRLHEIEISLFTPFRPMLGEQALPQQVEKLMNNQPYLVEIKYDGERVQLHKEGNSYKYFSRNGHEVTHVYGSSPLEGSLTPHISKSFKSNIVSCILDGEMVIYSNNLNCIVSKGENADVQAADPDGDFHPCYCVFDLLLLNGKVFSNKIFRDRIATLKDVLTPIEGKIQLTSQEEGKTIENAVCALNDAIDGRQEGIMIKNPLSFYRPNIRKNSGWLKVKPDYIDNVMDELDLLIIGGYYGEGRRSKMLSHFLLGVAEPATVPGEKPTKFCSFTKVGSGYSMAELSVMHAALDKHWKPFDARRPPPHLIIGTGHKEKPEFWIEPCHSKILKVRGAEIIRSDKYATNCSLRFPRVEQIRHDKSWHECMTTVELEDLRKNMDGRLARKHEVSGTDGEPSPKKARKTQPQHTISVAPQFRPTNVSDVTKVSEMFQDYEFCVMSTVKTKQVIEKKITEFGGKFVQNPGGDTLCVIADKLTVKVNNIINADMCDVVHENWLHKCFEAQQFVPWVLDDMIHSTHATKQQLEKFSDPYGDSYDVQATIESLKKAFDRIPEHVWKSENLTAMDIADLEFRYFSDSENYGLFRICDVYLDDKLVIGDESTILEPNNLKLTASKLKLYGAKVSKDIDQKTTHVIVHSKDKSRLQEIKYRACTRESGRFHIISEKWVNDSIQYKNMLREREYYLT